MQDSCKIEANLISNEYANLAIRLINTSEKSAEINEKLSMK
jgi:hypothetical protein